MKTVCVAIDSAVPASIAPGRIDPARVDATTKNDIALQQVVDEAEVLQDATKFAPRLGKDLDLNQAD